MRALGWNLAVAYEAMGVTEASGLHSSLVLQGPTSLEAPLPFEKRCDAPTISGVLLGGYTMIFPECCIGCIEGEISDSVSS